MPDGRAPRQADNAGPRPNRLARETSPYLLQHASNPVNWYPWGAEAWEHARAADKPVLVSIGYAACHWCHVMERESFENHEIANRQNELVISIKVDREERPDVDEVYMEAVQMLRGQGGWPLNVFCLPDGRPFFGGTYFPPVGRMGMPSWPEVLDAVSDAYRNRREELTDQAGRITDQLGGQVQAEPFSGAPDPAVSLRAAAAAISANYDAVHGGFGGAPKFPQPFYLRLLMHHAVVNQDDAARAQVVASLRKMAEGGLYDQVGGGFHRYSVDEHWLVPHFEKMLYDNALLAPLYLDAWRITGDAFFRRIAVETLDYLLRDMQTPEGAFYASTDADSDGTEGAFFVWAWEELLDVLGPREAGIVARRYGATPAGNFEGKNILHLAQPLSAVAAAAVAAGEIEVEDAAAAEREVATIIDRARARLFDVREERTPPATDTKVIAAWNGMTLDALARGGAILNEPAYLRAAERAADFLLGTLRTRDGLRRIYAGGRASITAFLDDYAALADGLLSVYEATGNERWYQEAEALARDMLAKFWHAEDGGFTTTGADNEPLIARHRPFQDGATPSGNSLAGRLLARLYALTGDGTVADRAEALARAFSPVLDRAPAAMAELTLARDWLGRHLAVAVVGDPAAPATQALLDVIHDGLPRPTVVMRRAPGVRTLVPQLRDKDPLGGEPTAYVCRGFTCSAPVTDPGVLRAVLNAGEPV